MYRHGDAWLRAVYESIKDGILYLLKGVYTLVLVLIVLLLIGIPIIVFGVGTVAVIYVASFVFVGVCSVVQYFTRRIRKEKDHDEKLLERVKQIKEIENAQLDRIMGNIENECKERLSNTD